MARSNLQIKESSYVGNGVDSTAITVGFAPDIVIVKASGENPMFRTRAMKGDLSQFFGTASAGITNVIQELTSTGFVVGSDTTVNTNGTTYYYIAIRALDSQNYLRTGAFFGDGTDNKNFTDSYVNFTPDLVYIKSNTTQQATVRTPAITTDNSFHVIGFADGSNEIQSVIANGFQVGTSARANGASQYMFYIVGKHLSGVFTTGTYVGNATARSITGLGFAPNILFIKNASSGVMVLKTTTMGDTNAFGLSTNTVLNNDITSLDTDGFTLGTNSNANGNTLTHYYIAFKSGDFNAPISRTSIT